MTAQPTYPSRFSSLVAALVVFACAMSAGIHAGLVPEHLEEMPLLGLSFIAAVVLLVATGVAVAMRPRAPGPASLAAWLFGVLIFAYAASRTTGLPVLEPEPEPVDWIGIATIAGQLFGALAALWLLRNSAREPSVGTGATRSTTARAVSGLRATLALAGLVLVFSTVITLGASGEHGDHGEGHEHASHDHAAMAAVAHKD